MRPQLLIRVPITTCNSGATPRNTVSGEISKLLNAVGPNNAPILKVNQGKLTKFFLRTRQKQQDGLYVYSEEGEKKKKKKKSV